ncbi:hypothetical protein IQ254_12325 [Nodosilinea sp. LEGE 07088]|uniref:hypothetical protein n=1 Tax=Nodosilinea sp. LEGE 07088 TaxID=2777968 RepID=UPI001882E146|nr:hypothetical protein [Nodosilinea sp. LEGE 07088]MBE9137968.1 hypothetical protein [Nodosilinea sp. LEGE 07088]
MAIKSLQYETLLSVCTDHEGALALLKRHRPYLEAVPSMRRPDESVITLPLPNVRVRDAVHLNPHSPSLAPGAVVTLPCDVALLMCDPEWKIKTGVEIFVYIHRPQEDFSDLLLRWRHTQILVDRGYAWLLPQKYQHLLSDGTDTGHPLFVVFPETPGHILQGLRGAGLPTVIVPFDSEAIEPTEVAESTLDLGDIPELDDIDTSALESPDE